MWHYTYALHAVLLVYIQQIILVIKYLYKAVFISNETSAVLFMERNCYFSKAFPDNGLKPYNESFAEFRRNF